MQPSEISAVADLLGAPVLGHRRLAGGFSHETSLLTLAAGPVVARTGGGDHAVEAAVMAAVSRCVPVPGVLAVLPAERTGARPVMVLEHVAGSTLEQVLQGPDLGARSFDALGVEVGRVLAAVGEVRFDAPGFFTGPELAVADQPPWSQQLAALVASWLPGVPAERLDPSAAAAWLGLCRAHAPELVAVDDDARLVHADYNPKNLLVAQDARGWRVTAVLDWEFSFSGCPFADAANMLRFAEDYPPAFCAGFQRGFAAHLPAESPAPPDWLRLGRVLDMFALSDLLLRPAPQPVSDRAARVVRRWVEDGLPDGDRLSR